MGAVAPRHPIRVLRKVPGVTVGAWRDYRVEVRAHGSTADEDDPALLWFTSPVDKVGWATFDALSAP